MTQLPSIELPAPGPDGTYDRDELIARWKGPDMIEQANEAVAALVNACGPEKAREIINATWNTSTDLLSALGPKVDPWSINAVQMLTARWLQLNVPMGEICNAYWEEHPDAKARFLQQDGEVPTVAEVLSGVTDIRKPYRIVKMRMRPHAN